MFASLKKRIVALSRRVSTKVKPENRGAVIGFSAMPIFVLLCVASLYPAWMVVVDCYFGLWVIGCVLYIGANVITNCADSQRRLT